MSIGEGMGDKDRSLSGWMWWWCWCFPGGGCFFADRGRQSVYYRHGMCRSPSSLEPLRSRRSSTSALDSPGSSSFQMGREGSIAVEERQEFSGWPERGILRSGKYLSRVLTTTCGMKYSLDQR